MAKKTGWMGDGEPGWFATLIGGAVLIVGGFSLGLVVGVVSEEPELVVGHLVGRSEQVVWSGGVQDSTLALEPIPAGGAGSETGGTGSETGAAGSEAEGAGSETGGTKSVVDPPTVSAPPPEARRIESLPVARNAGLRTGYAVQVGAFADRGAARSVGRKLVERGFDAYVLPAAGPADNRWRVRVGPVDRRDDAEALALRLKVEERLPTWILTEGGG